MSEKRPNDYSPLTLAYLGDSVWEQYVRTEILNLYPELHANKLHRTAIGYVSATSQSKAMERVEAILSEQETAVYKRGRNAKSPTASKNADIVDYRRATGFEALVGYLYLKKDTERLQEVMETAFEYIHNVRKELEK
ncbi:MAG: ribonuclease III domain-containing protein [Clostridia bacterium]|nr:ribonuclease III domain-containing protein [Clostridia bacterium]